VLPGLADRIDARWAAEAGRALTIWIPVFLLTAQHAPNLPALFFTAAIVTAIWFVTLRSAFGAVPFILGSAVPAFVGTLTGLVVVSAGNFWVPIPGTRLSVSMLWVMALSVFALSAAWEAAWRRQFAAKRRVLVVGTGSWAKDLSDSAEHARDVPFQVVGIVDDAALSEPDAGVPVLGKVADLSEIVELQTSVLEPTGDRVGQLQVTDGQLGCRVEIVGIVFRGLGPAVAGRRCELVGRGQRDLGRN